MTAEVFALTGTAAVLALVHTISGPDHYLPFIGMAKAEGWSQKKLVSVTLLCGTGHLASSFLIGVLGLAFGFSLESLGLLESLRGSIAGWGLIVFGLFYLAWGLRSGINGQMHAHVHAHEGTGLHRHGHSHQGNHLHLHEARVMRSGSSRALLAIFLLGPCEPLIPLLLVAAVTGGAASFVLVFTVFAALTLVTMLAAVLIGTTAMRPVTFIHGRRYAHALAGATILLCGLAIEFGGL